MALALAVASFGGCSAERTPPSEPSAASTPIRSATATRASASAVASPPTAAPALVAEPLPPLPPAESGELYLAVETQGIARLAVDAFEPVLPTDKSIVDMAPTPDGALYASFFDLGTVGLRDGKAIELSRTAYERFAFRPNGELFATPDRFEWAVHRFARGKWSLLRRRSDFRGDYDDNKLWGLAVTADSVWVSSSNGLFREAAGTWQRVEGPSAPDSPSQLLVYEDRIVGRFADGFFERSGESWTKLGWPGSVAIEALSTSGIAVGFAINRRNVLLGALAEGRPTLSEPLTAGGVQDVAVDEHGRAWVAGDYALSVVHPEGRIIAEYEVGTLAGVRGRIARIAVTRGGPQRLPAKVTPERWAVRGSAALFRSGKPLSAVRIELCASILGCSEAPWKLSATTAQDGSFEFTGVPTGDWYIHVVVPDGQPGCDGVFYETPSTSVSITRECATDGDHRCLVPAIQVCLPFEMPHRP